MRQALRKQAETLYKQGWSYNIISERLGVAKSTLSYWLKEIPHSPNKEVIKRIKEGPAKSGEIRHKKRIENIKDIKALSKKDVETVTNRDLMMLSIGLYIGEGAKTNEHVRMINSDPQVINLAIEWFQKICRIPKNHFSIALHIYPDISKKKAIDFWSQSTGIPKSQFEKIQVDKRENKSGKRNRKLPYGTVHLNVRSKGKKEYGVELHRRIIGWIEAIYRKVRV